MRGVRRGALHGAAREDQDAEFYDRSRMAAFVGTRRVHAAGGILGPSCGHPRFTRAAMAWTILVLAGLCEIAWAVGLKYTEHFTRPGPTTVTLVAMVGSVLLLEYAVRSLPLGTAYAIWTGIGVIGTVLFGIAVFGEPATAARLVCLGLILAGIIGLRVIQA